MSKESASDEPEHMEMVRLAGSTEHMRRRDEMLRAPWTDVDDCLGFASSPCADAGEVAQGYKAEMEIRLGGVGRVRR